MSDNQIPLSIDYSSRDFYSLKDDLIARIQTRLSLAGKTWSATDPSDFGVAMVEAFAHVGDVTNYYIDRVANEGYLATATDRQSLLNIAEVYGYQVSGYQRSSVTLTFSNPDTTTSVLVPGGTQVVVDVVSSGSNTQSVNRLTYTLDDDVSIPMAADGSTPGVAQGAASHGISVTTLPANAANLSDPIDFDAELLGQSNGLANQTFTLASNHVADGTVQIYVNNGNSYTLWRQVTHLADYGPTSPAYTLTTDSNNRVTVTFGDNVSGAVPSVGAAIKAVYVIGGGLEGNIEGGYRFSPVLVPSGSGTVLSDLVSITIVNDSDEPAVGGEDPESNDSIRKNAPSALRSMDRAVTLDDFRSLAMKQAGVGKAQAYASSPNSILLCIAPYTSDNSTNYYPGYDATNTTIRPEWYTLRDSVSPDLATKVQIGTSVTYTPPIYIPVTITVEYVAEEGFNAAQIESAIRYAVVSGYGFNYVNFDEVIYPEQIEAALVQINGIRTVRVVELYRTGGTPDRTTLIPANRELFVFTDAETTAHPAGSLMLLTTSEGTLSPAFQSNVYSYRITGLTTETSTDISASSWDDSNVNIQGAVTASGGSNTLALTPGVNTFTVLSYSADTTITRTYTITAQL